MKRLTALLVLAGALAAPLALNAALVNLGPGSFTALAPVITFDGMVGQTNPSITLAAGALGNVTVSFAGHFAGQTESGGFPSTLTDHTPDAGPLALGGGTTTVVTDSAPGATDPELSGGPYIYNGPISMIFSTPVAAVGLKGGYFDAIGATTIEAYGENGEVLGSIVNTALGFEFYGLADSTGGNVIKGISFFITGAEPAGFEIDNITFGAADVVVNVPDSGATLALFGLALTSLVALRRRLS
jgi:hypothetical protein